jgi:periplasmic protein CpxP/Spy
MNNEAKNRWQVRLAAVTIFAIGFAAGALAMNIYRGQQRPSSPEERRDRFEQVLDRLDLKPEQRTQVKAIFDDARTQVAEMRKQSQPKFHEVRKQTDERLQAVLTPEQWERFQQMMSERRGRRGPGRGRREGR